MSTNGSNQPTMKAEDKKGLCLNCPKKEHELQKLHEIAEDSSTMIKKTSEHIRANEEILEAYKKLKEYSDFIFHQANEVKGVKTIYTLEEIMMGSE
uniref:Uncharacterized protein n=1 Tax=Cannabis sativa TaxID=3483 RepID=A0A803PI00_CANSA